MARFIKITAPAIALVISLAAAPAHAQLGGLGGLGGTLGGTLGGGLGGTLGTTGGIDTVTGTVDSATSGTLRGRASTRGSQKVDRRSGRVQANRGANAGADGVVSQTLGAPGALIGAGGSGHASAGGNANADAQLIGTDAVGSTVQSVRSTANGAVSGAMQTANSIGKCLQAGGCSRNRLTRSRTGTSPRNGSAIAPISVVWLTLSNSVKSTELPRARSAWAKATVLRMGLTSVSLRAASSKLRGAVANGWLVTWNSGWESAGVRGQSNARCTSGTPMGKKSYGPARPTQPASCSGDKPSPPSQRGSSASMAAL